MHDALSHTYTHIRMRLRKKNSEFRQRVDKHEIIPLVLCHRRILAFYRIGNKSCARKFKPFFGLYPFGSVAHIHSFVRSFPLPKFECLCFVEKQSERVNENVIPFLPASYVILVAAAERPRHSHVRNAVDAE